MKKIITLAALLLSFASLTWAYDFSVTAPSGQTLYYNINSGANTVTVTYPGSHSYAPYDGYTCPTGALTIPSTVSYNSQTYSVTSIGSYAFRSCGGLASVTIGNSVTSIGYAAFAGCSSLASVTIPNSVTSIGDWAFYYCRGLTSVTIPNSVDTISFFAFADCTGLTSVTIPNSVTSIGSSAFRGCYGLTSVTIPNSVTSIGDSAFYNCYGLTSATIGNSVTSIGGGAFEDCYGLTSVTIPNSVTSIGDSAFYLVRNIVYSGTATGSPWGALCVNGYIEGDLIYTNSSKTNLVGCATTATNVTIPNSVTSIGDWAFAYCSVLTSVTIPNSVTSIGDHTFAWCSDLTSVTIPNSVTLIGGGAFSCCTSLTSVIIPNSVTSIGDFTFLLCSGLSSVTIGNSVTSIGDQAFDGCPALTEITSLASEAPLLGENTFLSVNLVNPTIPVYIPCGSSTSYYSRWSDFSNFVEVTGFTFSATSEDSTKGAVQVLTTPTCTNPEVVVNAIANAGYRFDHWSDGSTANPYSFTLTQDTVIEAYFVPEGSEGVNDVEVEKVVVRVQDGQIVVGNAMGETIRIFDEMGRCRNTSKGNVSECIIPMPAAGVYLVQVGDSLAQRVVVVR